MTGLPDEITQLEQQDARIQALFRLLFAVYERQDQLADRLEDLIGALEVVGTSLLSAHSRFAIESYLTEQIETERRKRGLV